MNVKMEYCKNMKCERVIAFHWSLTDVIHRQTWLFICLLIYLFYGLNIKIFIHSFSSSLCRYFMSIHSTLINSKAVKWWFFPFHFFPIDIAVYSEIFDACHWTHIAMTAVVITFYERKKVKTHSIHTIWFYGKCCFKIIMVLNVLVHTYTLSIVNHPMLFIIA